MYKYTLHSDQKIMFVLLQINGLYVYNTPANDVKKMMSLIKDDIEIVVINEAAHKYHEKNGTLPQKKNVIDMSPR